MSKQGNQRVFFFPSVGFETDYRITECLFIYSVGSYLIWKNHVSDAALSNVWNREANAENLYLRKGY